MPFENIERKGENAGNQHFLLSSKLVDFANNFKVYENSRKSSKRVENTGKRRNCSIRAISPFPVVFTADTYKSGLV